MAVPSRATRQLRRTLGEDAGGDLVTWLEEMRAEHARHMSIVESLGKRMDEGFAKVDDRFAKVDDRFAKVDERMADLKVAIAESRADLLKWSFVFWVGAVGAIAALAGVLK